MKLAIIDLGSNSFHLLVVEVDRSGSYTRIGDAKVVARMGQALRAGEIDAAKWEEGLQAVAVLVARARQLEARKIIAVGTSALREASNGAAFAEAVRERNDIDVEILSGDDEARLAFMGMRAMAADEEALVVLVDIGGGSVELAAGRGERCVFTRSLPLGVVRLRDRWLVGDGVLTKAHVQLIANDVRAAATGAVLALRALEPSTLVVTGGTPRRLARLASRMRDGAPPPGWLTRESVLQWAVHLVGQAPALLGAFGVDSRYWDTIGPGAVIVATLMTLLGFERARVSDQGLCDGVLVRELQAHPAAEFTHMRPGLRAAVTRAPHAGRHDEDRTPH